VVGKNKHVFSVVIDFYYLVKKADINNKPNFCEVDTAVDGKYGVQRILKRRKLHLGSTPKTFEGLQYSGEY